MREKQTKIAQRKAPSYAEQKEQMRSTRSATTNKALLA
jgi:hypothetical protein